MDKLGVNIREARQGDAAHILAYLNALSEEQDVDLPVAPGEFDMTVEEEQEFIRKHAQSDNSLMLVAEVGGEIVGVLTMGGGRRQAMRHVGHLGISVRCDLRGQGIGSEMMRRAIEWARQSGVLTRIQLEVYERNMGAIRLYERLGFVREGKHPRAFFQGGEYIDDLTMGLLL